MNEIKTHPVTLCWSQSIRRHRKGKIYALVDIGVDSATTCSLEPQELETAGKRSANDTVQDAASKRQGANQSRAEETQ